MEILGRLHFWTDRGFEVVHSHVFKEHILSSHQHCEISGRAFNYLKMHGTGKNSENRRKSSFDMLKDMFEIKNIAGIARKSFNMSTPRLLKSSSSRCASSPFAPEREVKTKFRAPWSTIHAAIERPRPPKPPGIM